MAQRTQCGHIIPGEIWIGTGHAMPRIQNTRMSIGLPPMPWHTRYALVRIGEWWVMENASQIFAEWRCERMCVCVANVFDRATEIDTANVAQNCSWIGNWIPHELLLHKLDLFIYSGFYLRLENSPLTTSHPRHTNTIFQFHFILWFSIDWSTPPNFNLIIVMRFCHQKFVPQTKLIARKVSAIFFWWNIHSKIASHFNRLTSIHSSAKQYLYVFRLWMTKVIFSCRIDRVFVMIHKQNHSGQMHLVSDICKYHIAQENMTWTEMCLNSSKIYME